MPSNNMRHPVATLILPTTWQAQELQAALKHYPGCGFAFIPSIVCTGSRIAPAQVLYETHHFPMGRNHLHVLLNAFQLSSAETALDMYNGCFCLTLLPMKLILSNKCRSTHNVLRGPGSVGVVRRLPTYCAVFYCITICFPVVPI